MTEDMKLLTGFLGECWHKWEYVSRTSLLSTDFRYCSCEYPIKFDHNGIVISHENRTFTTWQDLGDLKEKLVDKGLYDRFSFYAQKQLDKIPGPSGNRRRFDDWLLNPRRFCQLVADFLKEVSLEQCWKIGKDGYYDKQGD